MFSVKLELDCHIFFLVFSFPFLLFCLSLSGRLSLSGEKNVVKGCCVMIVPFHPELTWGHVIREGQTPVAHIMMCRIVWGGLKTKNTTCRYSC